MPQLLTCPKGHQWELPASSSTQVDQREVCPTCGAAVPVPPLPAPTLQYDKNLAQDETHEAETLAPDSPRPVPDTANPVMVPGYEILGELGRGGMGVVYKARQVDLNRIVALKMILAGTHASPQDLARFRFEAETVANLQHPNIVGIHEVGQCQGWPYFSLEYVDGGRLDLVLSRGPMPPEQAAQLTEILARAMHVAHQHGIIHRDLKPSNVLLMADGTPKISDFGLAKRLDRDTGATQTGTIMGTPSYMSPEQAGGKTKEIGPAADIYALGALLYDMLTARPPFRAATPMDTVLQVISEEPLAPRRLQPRVPRDLETICLKCLEKDPRRRYGSAQILAEELHRFLSDEPILARPVSVLGRLWRWCRRRPAVATASALALVGLLATVVLSIDFGLYHSRTAERLRQNAEHLGQEHQETLNALEGMRQERLRSERLMVNLMLDRGLALCEQGEVGRGMLWMARGLELAPTDPPELHQVIRTSLAGWRKQLRALQAFLPHQDAVTAAVIGPDGKTILTGCKDGTAWLWDANTGQLRTGPLSHQGAIEVVAFSPDGTLALTASADQTARLWDPATGQPHGQVMRHQGPVLAAAFSHDGTLILTGSADRTAQLRDATTGQPRGAPLQHQGEVVAVAISRDGKTLLTGSGDKTGRLWNAATSTALGKALVHQDEVHAVAFSPDGQTVLTGSRDKTARRWNVATGAPLEPPLVHQDWVDAIAYSADGKTILTGSHDKTARLWEAASGNPIGQPLQHQDWVQTVGFSPDGRMALTGSGDRTARFWDAATAKPLGPPLPHQGAVVAAVFRADGQAVLTGSTDRIARLWEAGLGQTPARTLHHDGPIMAVAFSPDSRFLLTGSRDRTARLWETATGKPVGKPMVHDDEVWSVAFSPDGRKVVTGGKDRTARRWDAATGERLGSPLVHDYWVRAVAFSPDGATILTGSGDRTSGEARLWDAAGGKWVTLPHSGPVWAAAFSPFGRIVMTSSGDTTAQLWVTATEQPLGQPLSHQSRIVALAFHPDGERMVTGSTDRTARLWKIGAGQPIGEPLVHQGAVLAVAFSPDGKTILTGSRDGKGRLWDTVTGKPLGPPLAHQNWVRGVAYSPNGKFVLTGSQDRTANLWEVPAPLEGDVKRLTLWLQVITGMELDADGNMRMLDASRWPLRKDEG